MNNNNLELLIPQFGESDDISVHQKIVEDYRLRLKAFPNKQITGAVATKNIGKGADWIVILVSVAGLYFAIPNAHKALRESWEEWKLIHSEFKSLIKWLAPHDPVYYPDQYLFLVAASEVFNARKVSDLIFLGVKRLPENNPDFIDLESLLFSFQNGQFVEQVAVSRDGTILWQNQTSRCLTTQSRGPPWKH